MSFAAFPKQQQVAQLLQRSLARGRLAHAYLFNGLDLGELELMAATLAKTLNCEQPGTGPLGVPLDSCDACSSCRRIDARMHPDVQWIRPESKLRIITIDQMRELMHAIQLKPTEAAYKVSVIVAADRLNVQAANAFLKTLEEPPPRSIVILLSTEPQQVLETILSRCLRLTFAGEPSLPEDASWLKEFAQVAATGETGLIARYQLLGILLNHLNQVKAQTQTALSAQSPLERYDDIDAKLKERWEDELTAGVEAEYRRQRSDVIRLLQSWLRDVWLETLQAGRELRCFPEWLSFAQAVAKRISTNQALENLEALEQLQRVLNTNVQEALALEVALLRLKL